MNHWLVFPRFHAWRGLVAALVAMGLLWGATPVARMDTQVVVASDQADAVAYNDGWQSGDNGGTGFGAWTLTTTSGNGSQNGFFIGSSATNGDGDGNGNGDINTGGEAFGLYANSGQTANAVRPFPIALDTADRFLVQMDNGFVQNGGTVGFGLQNSSGQNVVEFFFVGGQSAYTVQDSSGSVSTGIGFTDEGLSLAFAKTTGSGYSLSITPLGGSPTVITGTLLNPSGGQAIDRVRLFNANAGSGGSNNLFFNRLSVEDNIPTAIELASFAAEDVGGAARVTWETVSELNNAGFNLLRSESADVTTATQVNEALIPSQAPGSGQGFAYEWLDSEVAAGATYFYWLESVALDGTTALHGPASVTLEPPTAVTVGALAATPTRTAPAPLLALALAAGLALGWARLRR